jgi:hypothetical protein
MAINPSDTRYSIIPEVTEGTMPATGAFLSLDYIAGTTPTYTRDVIVSPSLRANRGPAGGFKVNARLEGGFDVHFKRDAAIELLMASALSGAWVETGTVGVNGDSLKAGSTDSSFTVEKWMKDGAAGYYKRWTGVQVKKFSLDCSAGDIIKGSFDLIGIGEAPATAASALTYTASSSTLPLMGLDVTSVTVAGLTGINFRSFSFSIEQDRETRPVLGSATPIGIGTSGAHKINMNLQLYMKDLTATTLFGASNAPVAVSITIGGVGNGYTITLPGATVGSPVDLEDASKQIVSIDFTGAYDATAATALQITRL